MDDQHAAGEESLPSGDMHQQPPPTPSTSPVPPLSRRAAARWRRVRRLVLVRRRSVAAALAGLAVLTGVRAASMPPVETTAVLVAAHDLPGGSTLVVDDVTTADLPTGSVPAGVVPSPQDLDGRTLAAPVRAGEPITDVRLVAPGLLDGYPGLVAAPVRVADPASVRLLAVGDRVDLLAVSPDGGAAEVVAEGAPVVAVPGATTDDGLVGGALVVVAVPEPDALVLAEAAVRSVLSVVLKR